MNSIVPLEPATLKSFQELENDLIFDHGVSKETVYTVTHYKLLQAGAIYWHVGACIQACCDHDGEKAYHEISESTGWAVSTLKKIHRTWREMRFIGNPSISFWLHTLALPLPADKRESYVQTISSGEMTFTQAAGVIARLKGVPLDSNSVKLQTFANQQTCSINQETGEIIEAQFSEESPEIALEVDEFAEPELRVKTFLLYVREFLSGDDEKDECDFCLHFIEEALLRKSPLCIKENIDISNLLPERIQGTKNLAKAPHVVKSPPTLEAITEYGATRLPVMPADECERCRDYYVSNNWRVGKNPMVDWKAAVNNWHRTWKDSQGTRNGRNPNIQTIAQRAMQEAGFVE